MGALRAINTSSYLNSVTRFTDIKKKKKKVYAFVFAAALQYLPLPCVQGDINAPRCTVLPTETLPCLSVSS